MHGQSVYLYNGIAKTECEDMHAIVLNSYLIAVTFLVFMFFNLNLKWSSNVNDTIKWGINNNLMK